MSILITNYGTHAGAVWHTLNANGELNEERLRTLTHLHDEDLHAAIGWLARENKIRQQPHGYSLGETNLVPSIGKNAGMVWRALDIWGDVSAHSLLRLVRLTERDFYAAIGWLACEGKLEAATDPNNTVVFHLR